MEAEKPTAATANLFTPSGWAFAIWGPIFLGEWLMMLYLTNVPAAAALGAAAAPGWCAATAAQVAWCAAFRPSVCGPSTLWVPAALLAATGVGLGVSHRAIRHAGHSGAANALVRWPVALHFGWITAASLVRPPTPDRPPHHWLAPCNPRCSRLQPTHPGCNPMCPGQPQQLARAVRRAAAPPRAGLARQRRHRRRRRRIRHLQRAPEWKEGPQGAHM